jgi:hypothetical protein
MKKKLGLYSKFYKSLVCFKFMKKRVVKTTDVHFVVTVVLLLAVAMFFGSGLDVFTGMQVVEGPENKPPVCGENCVSDVTPKISAEPTTLKKVYISGEWKTCWNCEEKEPAQAITPTGSSPPTWFAFQNL